MTATSVWYQDQDSNLFPRVTHAKTRTPEYCDQVFYMGFRRETVFCHLKTEPAFSPQTWKFSHFHLKNFEFFLLFFEPFLDHKSGLKWRTDLRTSSVNKSEQNFQLSPLFRLNTENGNGWYFLPPTGPPGVMCPHTESCQVLRSHMGDTGDTLLAFSHNPQRKMQSLAPHQDLVD